MVNINDNLKEMGHLEHRWNELT